METHISTRGTDLTEELRRKVDTLSSVLAEREPRIRFAKYVLEQRGEDRSVGAVLALDGEGTIVRHARSGTWDGAFEELGGALRQAIESGTD